jgi:GxxExxY protein
MLDAAFWVVAERHNRAINNTIEVSVVFVLFPDKMTTSLRAIHERDAAMSKINELCDFVRETAFAIHSYHRHGHLEKVYENALAHRLRKAGLNVLQQFPLHVLDEDGTSVGEYYADLIVEDTLIVELKACRTLVAEHVAQVLGYLRSARKEHGLLMNFGNYNFRFVNTQ